MKEPDKQTIRALCGKGGIRTLGTIAGTTVFETAPIGHSGTFPGRVLRKRGGKYTSFAKL